MPLELIQLICPDSETAPVQDPWEERKNAGARMARSGMEQSCCHLSERASRKFSAKNEWLAEAPAEDGPAPRASDCGEWVILFHPSFSTTLSPRILQGSSGFGPTGEAQQLVSRHFCAMARHLSAPARASDRTWSEGQGGGSLDLSIRQMFK
jgi:hypothetical protein